MREHRFILPNKEWIPFQGNTSRFLSSGLPKLFEQRGKVMAGAGMGRKVVSEVIMHHRVSQMKYAFWKCPSYPMQTAWQDQICKKEHPQSFHGQLTWWSAVRPSTFAVLMSAPRSRSFFTSSLSPLEQAAKNTHPSWNLTLFELGLGLPDSLFVSESSQRFNCWCLRNKALTCFPSSAMFVCNSTTCPKARSAICRP